METQNGQAVWEVVLRIDGSDVANATAFVAPRDKMHVVLGVVDPGLARSYADLVKYAAHLIVTGQYTEDGDGVHVRGIAGNEESSLPF